MTAEVGPELLDELKAYVRRQVRAGFTPIARIPEDAIEFLADDCGAEALRPHAEQATASALVELAEEEKTWPPVTDCDRLQAAFDHLEAIGILARQDFSCCQTCGHGEAWDEVRTAMEAGKAVRGYTFFHQQDTESAVDGYGLCLAYGAIEEGDQPAVLIAEEVARVLRAEGLAVTWDGTMKQRISVALDWKKRLE